MASHAYRPAVPCSAKSSRSGEPCRAFAVVGTTVCVSHGGAAPQVRKAAARRRQQRLAEERATRSLAAQGVQPLGDPLVAFRDLAGQAIALKDFAAAHVAELEGRLTGHDAKGTEQLREVVGLYERAMDRSGKFLADYVRLGIDERMARLTEAQAVVLVEVLDRVLARWG